MVQDPAARAIELLGGAGAADAKVVDGVEKRLVALAQTGELRDPVVHLHVDVRGVFSLPRRVEGFVPDALEISGLGAGTAAGDQEVAAVVEVEGGEGGIGVERGAFAQALDARVGGQDREFGLGEIEGGASEKFAVVGHVGCAERGVVAGGERGEVGGAACGGVGGDVLPGLEAGGRDQKERGGIGALDAE